MTEGTEGAEGTVHLRPFRDDDLDLLDRLATDPEFSRPFEWAGYRSPEAIRRRFQEDGLLGKDPRYLAVDAGDGDGGAGTAVGLVTWRDPSLFGTDGLVWEVGIVLAPEHRGRGAGTTAQRLLAEHLFETTRVPRIQAFTEAENAAEQRSLERAGFRREGVLRQAGFRGGQWRDVVLYAVLRAEL